MSVEETLGSVASWATDGGDEMHIRKMRFHSDDHFPWWHNCVAARTAAESGMDIGTFPVDLDGSKVIEADPPTSFQKTLGAIALSEVPSSSVGQMCRFLAL